MSELEIKELQEMQSRVNKTQEQLNKLNASQRFVYGLEGCSINPRCNVQFANSELQLQFVIPEITKDIFELLQDALQSKLFELTKERDALVICTKTSKFTPIDILDKE